MKLILNRKVTERRKGHGADTFGGGKLTKHVWYVERKGPDVCNSNTCDYLTLGHPQMETNVSIIYPSDIKC